MTLQPIVTDKAVSTQVAAPIADAALRLEGVSKTYTSQGRSVEALLPVNLEVTQGEFVCLVGPSGCGKSTLLSIIAGLESASAGSVWTNGQAVHDPGVDRVLLFQEAALFPWLDVRGNIEFGLRQTGVPRLQRDETVNRLIASVGLSGFERSFVHQLSGGMRQRVAIARAMAVDPTILLMDEPFGALDALTRDRLHAEVESLWSATRKTILFVTHNVREAVALGDRVLVFSPRPGRVVREFKIDLPRPRSLEDHALVDLSSEVMATLRREIEARERAQTEEAPNGGDY